MSKDNYRQYDKQNSPLKKKRAGVELTKSEVKEILEGRKQLRKQMKQQGVYSHREFELTASSLGLYFDKGKALGLFLFLWHKGAVAGMLAAMAVAFTAMYAASLVTEMRGHFTINLEKGLVDYGFELCETADFAHPTSRIYGTPVEDAPCISIADLPDDIDMIDGSHNGRNYFAHTFYLAKRGEGKANYQFTLSVNSESRNTSEAVWLMLFEDGIPVVYAKPNQTTGEQESLPAKDNDRYGYVKIPFSDSGLSAEQYEIVRETATRTYYRLIPQNFKKDDLVIEKTVTNVKQDEVHKYTVVIWLEGDDPDCTNDMIGGHIGMQMNFEIASEDVKE